MVFLRLSVKVIPPAQLGNESQPPGKVVSFLLVVPDPERKSMGYLACVIREHWGQLYPGEEPLDIKRLVDDNHPDDIVNPSLTVAQVFVDSGLAERDGQDQRATVRVIQNPRQQPPRYGSVVQNWGGHATFSNPSKPKKVLPPVPLFPAEASSTEKKHRARTNTGESPGGSVGESVVFSSQPPRPLTASDYALPSTEQDDDEEGLVPNEHDNHTQASPILGEEPLPSQTEHEQGAMPPPQRNSRSQSATNDHSNTPSSGFKLRSRSTKSGSSQALPSQEKQSEAEADIYIIQSTDQEAERNTPSKPAIERDSNAPSSSSKLRSRSAKPGGAQASSSQGGRTEADADIYVIQSTDQEAAEPKKRRRSKRGAISRSDAQFLGIHIEPATKGRGDAASNAIVVDSDVPEQGGASQAQGDYRKKHPAPRRGTRRSNCRGEGRKSMEVKVPVKPTESSKKSSPVSFAGAIKAADKAPIRIDDSDHLNHSDVEMVEAPKPSQTTKNVGQASGSPAKKGLALGANSAEKAHNTRSRGNVEAAVFEKPTPTSAGASQNASFNTASKPQDPEDSILSVQIDHSKEQDDVPPTASTTYYYSSSPSPETEAADSKKATTKSSSKSQGEITNEDNSKPKPGVSSTSPFPYSQGSNLRTPLQSAMRSSQKSSSKSSSKRRSVSFADDANKTKRPSPSPITYKGLISCFPPEVKRHQLAHASLKIELDAKLKEAHDVGKTDDYVATVEKVKELGAKFYGSLDSNDPNVIAARPKYEAEFKQAKKDLRNHCEDEHSEHEDTEEDYEEGGNKHQLSPSDKSPKRLGGFDGAFHEKPRATNTSGFSSSPKVAENDVVNGTKTAAARTPLKRKSLAPESTNSIEEAEQPTSPEPGPEAKKQKTDDSGKLAPKIDSEKEKVDGERPGAASDSDSDSGSGSDSDSDSESDSDSDSESESESESVLTAKPKPVKGPPTPTTARRTITPFSAINQSWPKNDRWNSDGPSETEENRAKGATNSTMLTPSQPAPSNGVGSSQPNRGFVPKPKRDTLKSLLSSQAGNNWNENAAEKAPENNRNTFATPVASGLRSLLSKTTWTPRF
ncbi:hypothetical protein AJ79_08396 [Helicocarpus griseus UAMH5409]|uniref:Nucleolar protein Dnt1-like N-terminal domain-containing protein n=1 Tax=Helicocarpus griseus UAMH5409 TaxID=1447875 RepID=A0A2B7WT47_9EURO|nr:hypothetical protein AJ79_08396 [Helicocarpus griseus UAMH5409]